MTKPRTCEEAAVGPNCPAPIYSALRRVEITETTYEPLSGCPYGKAKTAVKGIGWFHKWGEVMEPSGDTKDFALIELEDGRMHYAEARDVRFLDGPNVALPPLTGSGTLFTVGIREVYDPYIRDDPNAAKAAGGSVWRTQEEAEKTLGNASRFAVYGVLADWDKDTMFDVAGGGWRFLKRDCKLFFLPNTKRNDDTNG